MNKEKLSSLVKFKERLENSISSPTPPKHKLNEKSYREFLHRELKKVNKTIDDLRLSNA